MPRISIIMPVYNAEKTIIRAVKSVINQTFKDYELIIINDGSTDDTAEIVKSIIKSNTKVNFKTIKNSGVSVARNIGIMEATGEYITFLDSDDYYEKNALEVISSYLKDDIELLIYGHKVVDKDGKVIKESSLNNQFFIDAKDFRGCVLELIKTERLNAPWNKVYKRELIIKNSIHFPEDINIAEDLMFNLDYIKSIKNVRIINQLLINYVVVKNQGLVSNFRENRLEIRLRVNKQFIYLFKYWNLYDSKISSELNAILIKDVFAYFMDFFKIKCPFDEKQKLNKIKETLNIIEVNDAIYYQDQNNLSLKVLRLILKTRKPYIILRTSKLLYAIKENNRIKK